MAKFDFSLMKSGLKVFFGTIDYDRALTCNEYYHRVLKQTPPSAVTCFAGLDPDKINKKLTENPNAPLERLERNCLIYEKVKQLPADTSDQERLRYIRTLASYHANDAELMYNLAQILIQANQFGDAIHYLERTAHLDSKTPAPLIQISLIAALANDHSRAMQSARKALELGAYSHKITARSFVFSMLLLGMPARTNLYSCAEFFDPKRFADIPDREDRSDAVVHIMPERLPSLPVIMFACDDKYFKRFGKPLIKSLTRGDAQYNVHAHIINADDEDLAWSKNFSERHNESLIVTTETQTDAKRLTISFLSSARFLQTSNFIEQFDRPYLVIDTDSLLNDQEQLTSFLSEVSAPTFLMSAGNPLWDRVSAPFTYFPNDNLGRMIAAEIQDYLSKIFYIKQAPGAWYVDQLAIQGTCLKHIDKVQFVPARQVSDTSCGDGAIFWTLSNDKNIEKYDALASKLTEEFPDP